MDMLKTFKPKVAPVIATLPNITGQWQGFLKFETGVGVGGKFHFSADMMTGDGFFSGKGSTSDFPSKRKGKQHGVQLDGHIIAGGVELDLLVDHKEIQDQPFSLDGQMNENKTYIEGTFFAPCWYQNDCDCEGHTGKFVMERVVS